MDDRITATERIRLTLEQSRDPRVTRTRQAIVDAVRTLAAEGATSIGVTDIIRTAHVSRGTLYGHFASLERLALYIFEQQIESIERDIHVGDSTAAPRQQMRRFLSDLVAHYVENRALYSAVLALPVSLEVTSRAIDRIAEALLERAGGSGLPTNMRPDVVALYSASAIVGILDAWTRHDLDATAEQLVDHLLDLMPAWLVDSA